jgi:hypothetical protein
MFPACRPRIIIGRQSQAKESSRHWHVNIDPFFYVFRLLRCENGLYRRTHLWEYQTWDLRSTSKMSSFRGLPFKHCVWIPAQSLTLVSFPNTFFRLCSLPLFPSLMFICRRYPPLTEDFSVDAWTHFYISTWSELHSHSPKFPPPLLTF